MQAKRESVKERHRGCVWKRGEDTEGVFGREGGERRREGGRRARELSARC